MRWYIVQTNRFIKHVTETCSFQTTYLCRCESNLQSLYLPSSFTYVDVGAEGRNSDGGVFRQSRLYENIQIGSLQIPNDAVPPLGQQELPYVIVGDEAFPLLPYLMRPYSKPKNGAVPADQEVCDNSYQSLLS